MRLDQIPAERDFPGGRLQARRRQLVAAAAASLSDPAPRRRRRWVFVGLPAAVLVAAASAWTVRALTDDVTTYESIGCFDRSELNANVTVIDPQAGDPVAVCRRLWARGDVAPTTSVPPLRACVLASGTVGVFPARNGNVCRELGLADLPATYAREARRRAALRAAVAERFGFGEADPAPATQCVAPGPARRIVREELERHGFGDWTVQTTGPFSAERPCASLGYDGAKRAVLLIPVEPPRP